MVQELHIFVAGSGWGGIGLVGAGWGITSVFLF
jgi:hypothetical protein